MIEDEENYLYEDGNYGEGFENEFDEEVSVDSRSSSPIPPDDTPECIYCRKSLFAIPHTCGATEGCENKNSIINKDCQCKWHKQLNGF